VSLLLRRIGALGGFGAVLARGDSTAGAIAIVTHSRVMGVDDVLLSPMPAASGGYDWLPLASGEAIPGWIERARRYDPDLWVVELDIPDAARFVAETLGEG
jgi:hypothetical protein